MERTLMSEQIAEFELTLFGENRQHLGRSWVHLWGPEVNGSLELLAPPTWANRDG